MSKSERPHRVVDLFEEREQPKESDAVHAMEDEIIAQAIQIIGREELFQKAEETRELLLSLGSRKHGRGSRPMSLADALYPTALTVVREHKSKKNDTSQ